MTVRKRIFFEAVDESYGVRYCVSVRYDRPAKEWVVSDEARGQFDRFPTWRAAEQRARREIQYWIGMHA